MAYTWTDVDIDTSLVKSVHFKEIRDRIEIERERRGLSTTWNYAADPNLNSGQLIQDESINEMYDNVHNIDPTITCSAHNSSHLDTHDSSHNGFEDTTDQTTHDSNVNSIHYTNNDSNDRINHDSSLYVTYQNNDESSYYTDHDDGYDSGQRNSYYSDHDVGYDSGLNGYIYSNAVAGHDTDYYYGFLDNRHTSLRINECSNWYYSKYHPNDYHANSSELDQRADTYYGYRYDSLCTSNNSADVDGHMSSVNSNHRNAYETNKDYTVNTTTHSTHYTDHDGSVKTSNYGGKYDTENSTHHSLHYGDE